MKRAEFLQTGREKSKITEKFQKILQNLKIPLAFLKKVWYNIPRKRTDVFSVGFPYDFFVFWRSSQ